MSSSDVSLPRADTVFDAGQKGCGELIVSVAKRFRALPPGTIVAVMTYDEGAREDLPAWCRLMGHELLATAEDEGGRVRYYIRKGGA